MTSSYAGLADVGGVDVEVVIDDLDAPGWSSRMSDRSTWASELDLGEVTVRLREGRRSGQIARAELTATNEHEFRLDGVEAFHLA